MSQCHSFWHGQLPPQDCMGMGSLNPLSLVRLFSMTQGTQANDDMPIRHNITRAQRLPPRNRAKARPSFWGHAKFFTSQPCWERSMPRIERRRKWTQLTNAHVYTCRSIWLVGIKIWNMIWLGGYTLLWPDQMSREKWEVLDEKDDVIAGVQI